MPPVIHKDDQALERYQAEAKAHPDSAAAQANLGWGYYGRGQWAEAVPALQKALTLDPENFEAHYGLGLAYKAGGSKPEAIAAFEKALALAGKLEDPVRGATLSRIIRGHINFLNNGRWGLSAPGLRV